MDPLSAMIGGGLNLIGGLFNSSSQQAINARNLQAQTWSAEGGYLPGLRANAEKAGFNPLAVLGSRGPNMAVQVGDTGVGNALQNTGALVSKLDLQRHDLEMTNLREQIAHNSAITKQTMIDNAVKLKTLEGVEKGILVPPGASEPAERSTWPGMIRKGLEGFNLPPAPAANPHGPPGRPNFDWDNNVQPWDWRRYVNQLWESKR